MRLITSVILDGKETIRSDDDRSRYYRLYDLLDGSVRPKDAFYADGYADQQPAE